MKKAYAYVNGRFVPEAKATVSVFDRGLVYGDGLFETIRSAKGRPLFLNEHLERLKSGLESLSFSRRAISGILPGLKGVVLELLNRNGLSSSPGNIKILVTRGTGVRGHLPTDSVPTVIVTARGIDEGLISRLQRRGAKAVLLRSPRPSMPGAKTLNYLPNVMGRLEAVKGRAYEGIFVSPEDRVLEGTASNVFFYVGDSLLTPPPIDERGNGVLPGVVRAEALRLSRALGLKVKERPLKARELPSASEAFLTNSIIGLVPLVWIDGSPVGTGRPGPVIRSLQAAYADALIAEP